MERCLPPREAKQTMEIALVTLLLDLSNDLIELRSPMTKSHLCTPIQVHLTRNVYF